VTSEHDIDMPDYGVLPKFPRIAHPFFRDDYLAALPTIHDYLFAEWQNLLRDEITIEMRKRTPPVPWTNNDHAINAIAYLDAGEAGFSAIAKNLLFHQAQRDSLRVFMHSGHATSDTEWATRLENARLLLGSYRAMVRLFEELDAYRKQREGQ